MPAAHLWAGAGWGSPLAPARDGTGRDCSHGSPPTWHRSSRVPPQGWRRAEDPLLQRREGWLAARLVPLSSQSPSWSRDWNVFSEENTAEATAGRLWGHFSRGGCLTAAGSWHGTLLWLCHPAAGSPIPATCYLSNKNIWIYFFKKQSCVRIDFDELTFSRGKISSVEVSFLGVAVPYCTICNPPGTLHKAMNS